MDSARHQKIDIPARRGDVTAIVQQALDRAAQAPVHVCLGPGEHLSGGLRLLSDTVLELAEGAVLRFQPDYDAYAHTRIAIEAEQSDRAMIVAEGAARITLCGTGRIICDGASRFSRGQDAKMGTRVPMALRPRVLVFDRCEDVRLRQITVEDSPMWTLHFVSCTDLRIEGVRVDNDRTMPNTDGVVIDSCRNVLVSGCELRTADDGVVLKTSARADGQPADPCVDVVVQDCVVESRSCALKIGTESHADFRNITFQRCRVERSNRGLGVFSRDGGAVVGVVFRDIHLECTETPDGFWGSGEPLTVTVLDRRDTRPAGPVSDLLVEGLRGTAHGAINLWAERSGDIAGVRLRDVALVQDPGPLGTALQYDLRPTPADLVPSDEAAGRVNAWRLGPDGRVIGLHDYPGGLPGLFAEGVADLSIDALEVQRPDPLPQGWSRAPVTQMRAAG